MKTNNLIKTAIACLCLATTNFCCELNINNPTARGECEKKAREDKEAVIKLKETSEQIEQRASTSEETHAKEQQDIQDQIIHHEQEHNLKIHDLQTSPR